MLHDDSEELVPRDLPVIEIVSDACEIYPILEVQNVYARGRGLLSAKKAGRDNEETIKLIVFGIFNRYRDIRNRGMRESINMDTRIAYIFKLRSFPFERRFSRGAPTFVGGDLGTAVVAYS